MNRDMIALEELIDISTVTRQDVMTEHATMRGILQDVQKRTGVKARIQLIPDPQFYLHAGGHGASIGTENGTEPPRIIYTPTLTKVMNPFSIAGVLAHELAHLEHGDTERFDLPPEEHKRRELRADLWAAKKGFGQNLINAFQVVRNRYGALMDEPGPQHPGMQERIDALERHLQADLKKAA